MVVASFPLRGAEKLVLSGPFVSSINLSSFESWLPISSNFILVIFILGSCPRPTLKDTVSLLYVLNITEEVFQL
ncbi:hypothetical protein D3C81_891610 [compost metagenome]